MHSCILEFSEFQGIIRECYHDHFKISLRRRVSILFVLVDILEWNYAGANSGAAPVGVLRRVRPRRGVAGGRVAAGGRLGRHVAALPRLVSRLLRRTLLKFDQRWSVFGCIGTDFANKS